MKEPIEPGRYQLQFWNGMNWEVGHVNHQSMTWRQWRAIRSDVRQWSCRWRLVAVGILDCGGPSEPRKPKKKDNPA